MSLYIKRFAERVQTLDSRQAKDFTWPIRDAKNLQTELLKLLSDLDELRNSGKEQIDTIEVQVQGGKW